MKSKQQAEAAPAGGLQPLTITLDSNPSDAPCCIKVLASDGRDMLVQTDWDYPGIARTFGWDMAEVQPDKRTACFNRFSLELPQDCIADCSHSGQCYDDVKYWADEINRPAEITPEKLAAELKEYGAWESEDLADDGANWQRLIWIAAGNLKEEKGCEHGGTDGTIDCPECGLTSSRFIEAAREWIDDHDGAEAEDPGYFQAEGRVS